MSARAVSFAQYLAHVGLPAELASVAASAALRPVQEVMRGQHAQLDAAQLRRLLTYKVPKVSASGACSRTKQYEAEPFDLGAALGVPPFGDDEGVRSALAHAEVARIARLDDIVAELHAATKCDWLGVYHVRYERAEQHHVLLKEAYRGAASRAKFPLTSQFAEQSNNSHVAMTGTARLIADLSTHQGAYYECDALVQSELCVPIIDFASDAGGGDADAQHADDSFVSVGDRRVRVRGIIDAESFAPNFFTPDVMAHVARTAYELGFVY